jgi:hypothetical protein
MPGRSKWRGFSNPMGPFGSISQGNEASGAISHSALFPSNPNPLNRKYHELEGCESGQSQAPEARCHRPLEPGHFANDRLARRLLVERADAPLFHVHRKGLEVEIFSPNGGKCEADAMSDPRDPSGYSASDLISMGFIATPKLAGLIESTKPVSDIQVTAFDAIVVAGGQAPMATFENAHALHRKFSEFTRLKR